MKIHRLDPKGKRLPDASSALDALAAPVDDTNGLPGLKVKS